MRKNLVIKIFFRIFAVLKLSNMKNYTIYKNKPYLKIEKFPFYEGGGNNGSKLNKVYFKIFGYHIVSRVKKGELDEKKVELINKYTGGFIKDYSWTDSAGTHNLRYSFVSKNNDYIGDANKGFFYLRNNLLVCLDKHNQVAIALKKPAKIYKHLESYKKNGVIGGIDIKGFYGYSHRAGQLFQIGDRIFDAEYKPKKEDYPAKLWDKWEKEYNEKLKKADDFDKEYIYDEGIVSIIPFKYRGKKVIAGLDDAKQAAINFANYIG